MRMLFILSLVVSFGFKVQAAELDAASQKAVQQTQDMLRNPAEREKVLAKDPSAKKWDQQVHNLGGGNPQNSEELYSISADVFGDLAKQTGGDSLKMIELMEKAKANPEAFYNSLSPEQKAKISDFAKRLPAAQQGGNSAPNNEQNNQPQLPTRP